MMKFLSVLIIEVLICLSIFLSSCSSPSQPEDETVLTPIDSPALPARGFFMGVLPIPNSGQSFEDAYAQAAQYAEFSPVWGTPTPFYSLADDLSGSWGQTFVEQYIRENDMFPLIHLSFMGPDVTLLDPPGMECSVLGDPQWRDAYKQAALDAVKASKPLYVSLGNEVNRWYEAHGTEEGDPNGFQHYVSLYEEIYDAIKEIAPKTNVFCIFAREIVDEFREANLSVLEMFNPEKIDLLVFTSYPHAVSEINYPEDIPDNYYQRVLNHFPDKMFGFSEIAWPSHEAFGGEEKQTEFILQVTGRLTEEQGITLHLLGWPWLHDLNENDYTGLKRRNGLAKMAFEVWETL